MAQTNQETITSTSLIHRLQLRDGDAWSKFVDLYGPLLWYWCRGAGMNPSDADDVCQNVFATVTVAIGKYTRSGSFRGWLWQVTRNKIIDHFRKQKRTPKAVGGTDFGFLLHQLPEIEPAEFSQSLSKEALIVRALELIQREFEDATWQAFTKMTFEKKSADEAAKELNWAGQDDSNLKKGAKRVRQAKFRVLRRLKAEFGDLLEIDS